MFLIIVRHTRKINIFSSLKVKFESYFSEMQFWDIFTKIIDSLKCLQAMVFKWRSIKTTSYINDAILL